MALNCLLISTNLVDTPFPVYPLGAAHLVGALENAGHSVSHFDFLANEGQNSFESFLKKSSYDLIAISIRNLDTTDSNVPSTFIHHTTNVVELIKLNTKAKIVIGGPAFSIMPEKIYDILKPDFGVVGEGEYILPWLADCIENENLPEEKIIRASKENKPWKPVSYSQSITKHYIKHGGMLNIQTKRGCPYKCSYCSYPSLEGNKIRTREPEEIVAEIERLTSDFGAKYIFFADAVFNDPADHYLKVSEALIKSGNKTPWCGFFRPDQLTAEKISLMKAAGLSAMELGTDASSDATLAGLQKGFGFEEVLKVNKAAHKERVPVAHFIIFGGPGENEETFQEGLANIEKLNNSVVFGFVGIRILPGTKMFEIAVEAGICNDDNLLDPVFYYSPDISREQIDSTLKKQWYGRFDRVYPWSEMEPRIKRLHQKGYVGPMWDFLVKR